ncbi:SusD-like starch-binding protein associating with outer membrane [Sphingobacterium allocomposti]|uniref:SusD-like starch-binding protein associating with outer membrane n=1 Tax=Sphingobacterium allocomposti TaxID=415956 RepID=A0A5S5D8H0_9SPHI|nr:RagB/SusD family nutrient uptake outer membrane protein [Sphingobacterium composti Yoo et al. 2007 non Ten et al. 2007]TYP91346.1 SusD-like starch-binding protein associating with outer membrane [Sphingobacterium composti Yoo et al. 2007 non Ten et al. 2007]
MKVRILYGILLLLVMGCREEFLDLKADKQMVIPESFDDMEALLDYTDLMNRFLPWMEEVQADDYYILEENWQTLSSTPEYRNAYVWAKDIFEGDAGTSDWKTPYRIIFQANVVLDGLLKINSNMNSVRYNEIKARALFFRSWQFFRQIILYAPAYDTGGDNRATLGVPLRLNSGLHETSVRASLEESLQRVVSDLQEAESLFADVDTHIRTRPSKAACQALLARVFLYLQKYEEAGRYAGLAISNFKGGIIDLSSVNSALTFPMPRFNREVIFHSAASTPSPMTASRLNVDSVLYASYGDDDLRKTVWFRMNAGRLGFRGSYDGSSVYFNGLTVAECLLTRAECLIRQGELDAGLRDLTTLLRNRVEGYVPPTALDRNRALAYVLSERRKELVFKGVRWMDLKRLNLKPETARTISRRLGGRTYQLLPNSPNYVYPIQPDVIELTGMIQNERQ